MAYDGSPVKESFTGGGLVHLLIDLRGKRFELNLILNILGHLLAIWLLVLMENDRDGISKACATKLSIRCENVALNP